MNFALAHATLRELIMKEALETILANTEEGAIKHIAGQNGLSAYDSLAKDIADCAKAALDAAKEA